MKKQKRWQLIGMILLLLVLGFIAMPNSWDFKQNLFPNSQATDGLSADFGIFNRVVNQKLSLGLDLQGGTQLKYRIDMSEVPVSDQETIVDGIISVMRNRVDGLGVSEPIIQSSKIGGSYFVIVELPGIKDIDEAINVVGKTVQLEFKEQKTEYTEAELVDIRAYNEGQKVRAEEALGRALAGDTFTNLVHEYSEGDALMNDGTYDFLTQAEMGATIGTPVASMQPEEMYGELVDGADGYYIIKLLEKKNEIVTSTDADGNEVNAEEPKYKLQVIRLTKKPEVPQQGWKETGLTGKQFKHASVEYDQSLNFRVSIQFDDEGKGLFGDITSRNVGQPVAIFLDNEPISTPTVQEPILNGEAVITGNFTQEEAQQLAMNLNTGAIPAPVILIGQSNVGATLGQNALSQGVKAGMIGLIILGLFILVYYRLPGLVANLALAFYAVIIVALFKILGVTLTLAGIAGVILSIGMAVDANILIFERFKEELKSGKSLLNAIEIGFKRAWTSIRDSNISSLITCAILFTFGTGIIKGFAVTLAIGILVSMFTAINITKLLLSLFVTPSLSSKISIWGVKESDIGTWESIEDGGETRAEKRRKKKRKKK